MAAAASTSTKTGATFKEGAESPRSPASGRWRAPTRPRGPTRRSGGAGKQVRTRPGAGSGEERRGSAPAASVAGPRLRLHSPHLNQEAAESEAPLLRPFLCVGPGAKEGTSPRAAARSPPPSGTEGLPVPWVGPAHGEPTAGTHLAFSSPSACLFVPPFLLLAPTLI